MLRSMTAYSRESSILPTGRWVVEVHSVNRKFLDVHVNLPKELLCFDIEIRKWVAEAVQRGQINVRITLISQEGAKPLYFPHMKALKQNWEQMAKDLGYDQKVVDLPFLVQQLQEVAAPPVDEDGPIKKELKKIIDDALAKLIEMKVKEGKALQADIEMRLDLIENSLKKIAALGPKAAQQYQEKLKEQLKEWSLADDRILREVVLYAERVDITEELTRLSSHLVQFRQKIKSPEKSVGRVLDFFVQEMHREINTVTAKSSDNEITLLAVDIKSELEKIKEQVQNIE